MGGCGIRTCGISFYLYSFELQSKRKDAAGVHLLTAKHVDRVALLGRAACLKRRCKKKRSVSRCVRCEGTPPPLPYPVSVKIRVAETAGDVVDFVDRRSSRDADSCRSIRKIELPPPTPPHACQLVRPRRRHKGNCAIWFRFCLHCLVEPNCTPRVATLSLYSEYSCSSSPGHLRGQIKVQRQYEGDTATRARKAILAS